MRRFIAAAATAAVTGAFVVLSPLIQASSATSGGADLAVSGFIAGGEQNVASYHAVVFVFKLKNHGPRAITSSADQSYTSVSNGTVTDQLCVFPNGSSFDADSPGCEYGTLNVGQSAQMTLIVQPDSTAPSGAKLSVRVCSSNVSGVADPVSDNNCLKKSVTLQ